MSEDMVGGREGRLAADVGAGGGYRRGESGYDLPRHWMIRDSKADCIESSRNDVRYAGRPLDDDRQLAGPEGGSKLQRRIGDAVAKFMEVIDTGDEQRERD